MLVSLYNQLHTPLHWLPAEAAHTLAICALKYLPVPAYPQPQHPVEVAGVTFPNRVGLAAGFDKNGDAIAGLSQLGFGFIEVGTVTPKPQAGNPKPRLFRIKPHQAIINRMGFNNKGHAYVQQRLQQLPAAVRARCRIGVNIGKNKDSDDAIADYTAGIRAFATLADYLVINISSPNTPNLRLLQQADALEKLLDSCNNARASQNITPPLWLKIAPDVSQEEASSIAALAVRYQLGGIVVSNTTITRPLSLTHHLAGEAGGLSGAPLTQPANTLLGYMAEQLAGRVPLIGVGGIMTAADAAEKIQLGAQLVQLYSGFVYHGIPLVQSAAQACHTPR